ncbi:MAG: ribosome maturation factor RimM [Chloroflexota bacterium]|nr:ribosome maturation factor RimM [Chloroflexota bacterium]
MPDAPDSKQNSREAGAPDQGTPASARPARPTRRRKPNPRRLIDTRGPEPTDPVDAVRLTVGRIGGPHGLNGEVRMALLTDAPDHLLELEHVYLGNSDEPVTLDSVRFHGDQALVSFEGIHTPEAARKMGGLVVKIDGSDAKPLEEGEYFLYQMIGLRAITPEGDDIGVVVDLMETGASDVLVIAPDGSGSSPNPFGDLLIPNHPVYVHEINPADGVIVVTKPVYPEDVPS